MSGTNRSRRLAAAAKELAARDGLTYQQAHAIITARMAVPPLWADAIDWMFGPGTNQWCFLVGLGVDGVAFSQGWEMPEAMDAYMPRSKRAHVVTAETVSGVPYLRAGTEYRMATPDHDWERHWSWGQAYADAGVTWESVQRLSGGHPQTRHDAVKGALSSGRGFLFCRGPRELCDLLADDAVWSVPGGNHARTAAAALLGEVFPSLLLVVAAEHSGRRSERWTSRRIADLDDVTDWPEGYVEWAGEDSVVHIEVAGAEGALLLFTFSGSHSPAVFATVDVDWSGDSPQLSPDCVELPVADIQHVPANGGPPRKLLACVPVTPPPVAPELWAPWWEQIIDTPVWDILASEQRRRDLWAARAEPSPVSQRTFTIPASAGQWWAKRAERMERPPLSVLLAILGELPGVTPALGTDEYRVRFSGDLVPVEVSGSAEQWQWLDSRLAAYPHLSEAQAVAEVLAVGYQWAGYR